MDPSESLLQIFDFLPETTILVFRKTKFFFIPISFRLKKFISLFGRIIIFLALVEQFLKIFILIVEAPILYILSMEGFLFFFVKYLILFHEVSIMFNSRGLQGFIVQSVILLLQLCQLFFFPPELSSLNFQ